uniref:Uncharacterized protein n=1 Tax=Arundo donax TaxID=35708 RepID=A0A0A9CHB6_ARUDO
MTKFLEESIHISLILTYCTTDIEMAHHVAHSKNICKILFVDLQVPVQH